MACSSPQRPKVAILTLSEERTRGVVTAPRMKNVTPRMMYLLRATHKAHATVTEEGTRVAGGAGSREPRDVVSKAIVDKGRVDQQEPEGDAEENEEDA